jgi:hypothetical protein
VHVYVDRALGVSVLIPDLTREALATLLILWWSTIIYLNDVFLNT